MSEQIRKPLPESLMKAIKASVESPDLTASEKFEAVLLMTHGYGLFSAQEKINPQGYAIPEEQWYEISGMLMTLGDGDINKVNYSLSWMNIGPSGYRPEKEQV